MVPSPGFFLTTAFYSDILPVAPSLFCFLLIKIFKFIPCIVFIRMLAESLMLYALKHTLLKHIRHQSNKLISWKSWTLLVSVGKGRTNWIFLFKHLHYLSYKTHQKIIYLLKSYFLGFKWHALGAYFTCLWVVLQNEERLKNKVVW